MHIVGSFCHPNWILFCRMCGLASTALKEGMKKLTEGDEEMAYVSLEEYANLFLALRDRPEYEKEKRLIYTLLGGMLHVNDQLDQHRLIAKNLEKRYW